MSKTAMANPSHAAALAARHADLDAKLEREAQRPFPDAGILARMKKMKLQLKDAMSGR